MSNLYLRKALTDIINGYTECEVFGKAAFIKHFTMFDQTNIESMQEKLYEKARKRGLPTEEEALSYLLENEIWTNKDEAELLKTKKYIETLEKTKSNKFLISEIQNLNKIIETENQKYYEILTKKRELLGQTCEVYSENRTSENYIFQSFYSDKNLQNKFFNQFEIDELERENLVYIIGEYNKAYEKFKDINIQKIILADFFNMYMPFCDSIIDFFNKPIFELSINQVKLITYSKMFKNVFENYTDIPDSIKNDPEKIFEFINAKEKGKKVTKNIEKSGASTIVGAQKEDYKNLGMESKNSLSEMLRKNNGKMDMNDLAKLME